MSRLFPVAMIFSALMLFAATDVQAQTQATGGGWFRNSDFTGVNTDVNVGFNVRLKGGRPEGHLNFHNRRTGFKADGVVTDAIYDPDGCNGSPSVVFSGYCPNGSCTGFEFHVEDGGEPNKGTDWVCRYSVNGPSGNDVFLAPLQLNGGNFQVR